MPDKPKNLSTDLRGAKSLTIDAITGVSGIVESMHKTISGFAGVLGRPDKRRKKEVSGKVYKSINMVTELVGSGLDVLLRQLGNVLGEKDSSSGKREAVLSAINGVLGDHLVATKNPLQIPMQFRRHGKPLNKLELNEAIIQSNGRLLILVHGSCMNDLQWHRQEHDHGAALARDLGFSPIYLHYNSGLHISENGRKLADLLEEIVENSAQNVDLTMLAHSMGGLVSRSACYYADQSGYSWPNQLDKLVFLGTPHHGAPLEKGSNLVDHILEINRYSAPFSRLLQIRSSGITDLRYGNLVDNDWKERNRFKLSKDPRTPVPLPESAQCYAIAASKGEASNKLGDDLIGDGLVTVRSALGHHKNTELELLLPQSQQWIGRQMNHWDLLHNPDVYRQIKQWLETDTPA